MGKIKTEDIMALLKKYVLEDGWSLQVAAKKCGLFAYKTDCAYWQRIKNHPDYEELSKISRARGKSTGFYSNIDSIKTRIINRTRVLSDGEVRNYDYLYTEKSPKLERVEKLIPTFLEHLKEFSPCLSSRKAGFRWETYRNVLIKRDDVRLAIDEYMERTKASRTPGWS